MYKNRRIKNKTNIKALKLTLLGLLAAVAVYLPVAWAAQLFPFAGRSSEELGRASQSSSDATEQSELAPSDSPKVDKNTDSGVGRESEKDLPSEYEGPNPNLGDELTGWVSYKSVSVDKLILRVTIEQTLGSGSCELTMTNTQTKKIYTETSKVIANPSSASCEGFDIAMDKLGRGSWEVQIKVSGSGRTGLLTDKVEV